MAAKKAGPFAPKPSSSQTPPPSDSQLVAVMEMLTELQAKVRQFFRSARKEMNSIEESSANSLAQHDLRLKLAQRLGIDVPSYPAYPPVPPILMFIDDYGETTDDDDDDDDVSAKLAEMAAKFQTEVSLDVSILGDSRRFRLAMYQVEDQREQIFAQQVGIDITTYPAYPPVPTELEFTDDDDEMESFSSPERVAIDQFAAHIAKMSAKFSQSAHLAMAALRYNCERRHVEDERLHLLFEHLGIDAAYYYVPVPDEIEFTDDEEVTDNDDTDDTTDDDDSEDY